ncbi:hypothetical protein [Carboxydothermus ferrireducens]|uniref:Uncharacterized protein n=1 Tax=Carboxydothermus ferrireducens DSM 11255 TaxID=1119529 RepID=A0ABX2R7P9_9THEO|nr:hypothetical protein [Carboxydothermus ferrireducens]NYE57201.1 hypothetical protein [Carboxydothermus ferrireducens DSM 11255]
MKKSKKKECDHVYERNPYCGAWVCVKCDDHKGLERYFCGWSRTSSNGYRELLEMGETIEE